ncbi:hypothetical protein VFPBJ_08512 [Purpureocillium lilacinum]|uniref:Uncharacterized protein n=1 Tax=Purpureocillium lilacinum TaxID=33203 RepID=A0A179GE96_PURLI|nr:hypothetical protein VFPBJ_08512 [Purpureocillium lilacinum]
MDSPALDRNVRPNKREANSLADFRLVAGRGVVARVLEAGSSGSLAFFRSVLFARVYVRKRRRRLYAESRVSRGLVSRRRRGGGTAGAFCNSRSLSRRGRALVVGFVEGSRFAMSQWRGGFLARQESSGS